MPQYRSKTSTHGRNMAGARALWRATGVKDDDFGKPIIAHDQGVFRDVKKIVKTEWITLPSEEVPIDYTKVPQFLHTVFWGSWWEIDENKAKEIINNLIK